MLKLEILIALFATMLKVQADAGIEYTHHVPECHKRIEAERAIAGPREINAEHVDFDREQFEKSHNNHHEKKKYAKKNHHHRQHAAALSEEEMPIRHHAHHEHREHAHKHCELKHKHAEQGHRHHEREEAHRLAHHARKHSEEFEHELDEEKPLYAHKKAHKHAHKKAHKHAHCGIVEGRKMNERGHFKDVEHVHPVRHHAHHDHKTFYAHKRNHADKGHRDGHPIEHIKKSCPLTAHLNAGARHNKHKRFIHTMPGKGRADHDSNDFTSFEVAQLDILRVTKLDSEHAHDLHSSTPSKDVKKAILHRAAEFKKGAHKAHGKKPAHKENKDKLRKLKRQSQKLHHEKSADSDDDVREHIKALKKTHRALKKSHKKENDSDESDDKKAKLRALIQARIRKQREEKEKEKEKEKESEKPLVKIEDSEKKTVKGFKNALKKTFSFGKKNNKDAADEKDSKAKGDDNNGKDLHLKAKDRVRLVADLKAISELDREALQYLDTSCGPVKSLDKKKKKKLSRHAKKEQKKKAEEKKKQTASN